MEAKSFYCMLPKEDFTRIAMIGFFDRLQKEHSMQIVTLSFPENGYWIDTPYVRENQLLGATGREGLGTLVIEIGQIWPYNTFRLLCRSFKTGAQIWLIYTIPRYLDNLKINTTLLDNAVELTHADGGQTFESALHALPESTRQEEHHA